MFFSVICIFIDETDTISVTIVKSCKTNTRSNILVVIMYITRIRHLYIDMYMLVGIMYICKIGLRTVFEQYCHIVIMYKLYSALTYFPSCTELLTNFLENP